MYTETKLYIRMYKERAAAAASILRPCPRDESLEILQHCNVSDISRFSAFREFLPSCRLSFNKLAYQPPGRYRITTFSRYHDPVPSFFTIQPPIPLSHLPASSTLFHLPRITPFATFFFARYVVLRFSLPPFVSFHPRSHFLISVRPSARRTTVRITLQTIFNTEGFLTGRYYQI